MSLRDRFKSTQKISNSKIKQETSQTQQVQYYATSSDANNSDSLGFIDTILFDDDLNSVFISGARNVYIERNGKTHKSTSTYRDNVQLENLIKKLSLNNGIDIENEGYEAKFNHRPGINILSTIAPLSNVPSLYIKVYNDKHANIQNLQQDLVFSKELALLLESLSAINKNILITGDRNTLKTTLLSTIAKKTPANLKAAFLDNENEVRIDKQNFINYNLAKIENKQTLDNLLNMVFYSTIDKVYLNCDDEKLLYNVLNKIQNGFRGLICTTSAKDPKNAVGNLAKILFKLDNKLDFEQATSIILNSFDIIIHTKKDVLGKRKIESVIEINPTSKDRTFDEIFYYDYTNVHKSTGIIPRFYEDIKNSSLIINENIFDKNYCHTYYKSASSELEQETMAKRSANIEILKKFKKDLQNQKEDNSLKSKIIENTNKAQETKDNPNSQNNSQDNSQDQIQDQAQDQDNPQNEIQDESGEILYNENL